MTGRHRDDVDRPNETRWQSFRAANRNLPLKQVRILVVIAVAFSLYGYGLLCLSGESLSYEVVTQVNARRAEQAKRERAIQLEKAEQRQRERKEARLAKRKQLSNNAQQAKTKDKHETQDGNNNVSKEEDQKGSDEPKAGESGETAEHKGALRNGTHSHLLRGGRNQNSDKPNHLLRLFSGMSGIFLFVTVCSICRILLRICIFAQLNQQRAPTTATTTTAARPNRTRSRRQERFRAWVQNLNRQRLAQGERPLSLESLRLVLRERDLTGNDYDGLLTFNEEAGPAMEALLRSMGATREEIDRCPHRTLDYNDDLLKPLRTGAMPQCAVCLEVYQVGDSVRTIPCFHSFHVRCIDPWLSQKAVCPVCKHPAVG